MIIRKGKHSLSNPFKMLMFWTGPKQLMYRVKFDRTWKQSWPGEDMNDVNKLIGFGCLNLLWWIKENVVRAFKALFTKYKFKFAAPHHWKSTRLGIDYNETLDVMDAYEYLYFDGVRFFKKVYEFQFNVAYIIMLTKTPHKTSISICDDKGNTLVSFDGPAWRGVSYLLRPYMGGNNPARIDTNVNLKRL
jgi:hypothetical protein